VDSVKKQNIFKNIIFLAGFSSQGVLIIIILFSKMELDHLQDMHIKIKIAESSIKDMQCAMWWQNYSAM